MAMFLLLLAALAAVRSNRWEEELDVAPQVQLLQRAAAARNRGSFKVWLPSGPELRDSNDTFYHVHIPKVAGLSFGLDALDVLSARGLRMISREGCNDSPGLPDPRPRDRMVQLRSPQAHVLSMYNFCMYSPGAKDYVEEVSRDSDSPFPETFGDWVRNWTEIRSKGWGGDFTPSDALVHEDGIVERALREFRIGTWEEPPFALPPREDLSQTGWAQLDGGGALWHFVNVPFKCYAPMDFQSQRMTCTKAMEFPQHVDVDVAIRKMEEAFHVGIVEAYQASLCVLNAKIANTVPSYCDCTDAQKWASFQGHQDNVNEGGADDPKKVHQAVDLPQEVRNIVDDLTRADQQLFTAAWARLVREARWVEANHGIKVLCNETQPSAY